LSWYVEGNLSIRDKVSEAQDNLDWLRGHSHELSGSEVYRVEEINKAKVWKQRAFEYLSNLRAKHDEFYAQAKSLSARMAKTSEKLREYQLKRSKDQMIETENLIDQVENLRSENHWLRVENEGLKQTASHISKAKSR
jgi:hypothetical protein